MTRIEEIEINGVICNLYVTDTTTPVNDLRTEVINKLKKLYTF